MTADAGYDPDTAVLDIHICAERRGYRAVFATEDQAIAFLSVRYRTHAWCEVTNLHGPGTGSIPAHWHRLIDYLYPICEHGLSEAYCYGPDHYMSAAQEAACDFQYADAPPGF
jgi:hypothetical protein